MLKAFTLASKNNNSIILDFIRRQVTPKPINLFNSVNILMNDFATQQNVIMELLSDEVKKVLGGDRTRVRQLKLEPGDLQIFKGRFTLHRVTMIEGLKSRYMCIPAYVLDPWRVNTPEHSKAIYGKILPIHIERNQTRSDGLTD